MKAKLILNEMPKNCIGCPVRKNQTCVNLYDITRYTINGDKPDWCPLKPCEDDLPKDPVIG